MKDIAQSYPLDDSGVPYSKFGHNRLTGLADDDHTQYSSIVTGSGKPSSTPSRVGNIYVDTVSGGRWVAVGTSSSADWYSLPVVGWQHFATPQNLSVLGTSLSVALVAGEAIAAPYPLFQPMLFQGVTAVFSAAAQWEYSIYQQATDESTLSRVVHGSRGSASAALGSALDSPYAPVYLERGIYWLVIMAVGAGATIHAYKFSDIEPNLSQTKVVNSLGDSLDFVTSWTKSIYAPRAFMFGRVFGQTVGYAS